MLVTVEGLDGSGKSTVVASLARALGAPADVVVTREPTATWLGRAVRRGIRDELDPMALLHLFMADRAQHVRRIRRWLAEGRTVVSDRYADSTIAYQSVALSGRVDGAFDWLWDLNWSRFPRPERTVFLELDPEVGLSRIAAREVKEPFERAGFLIRVREAYHEIGRRDPGRWAVVDASGGPDEVAAEAVRAVAGTAPGHD